MGVSHKTVFVLALTVVVLMAVLYGVTHVSTLRHYSLLEEDEVRGAAERVHSELNDVAEELARTADDYAAWDTMYSIMKRRSFDGIAREFQDGTLQGLRVNLVMVLDSAGRVVYFKKYDFLQHSAVLESSKESQAILLADSWVRSPHASAASGFLQLGEQPVLIAACPILGTDRQGPSRGTLVMAINFDSSFVAARRELTRVMLSVETVAGNQLSGDSAQAFHALTSQKKDFWIKDLDDNNVAAFAMLNDVHEKPLLLVRVTEDRRIYQRGLSSLRTFVVSLGLAGVVFCLATSLLLKRLVLSRLTRLNLEIQRIEKLKNLSQPLQIEGNDEIAEVGMAINHMLEALQKSESALRLLADNIRQVFWVNDAVSQKVTYVSPAYEKIWGQSCARLYADPDSWRKSIYTDDLPLVIEMLRTQREGALSEIEFRIVKPDGSIGWIWGRYFPVVDAAGDIQQYIGLMEEITEYKTAEEVLLNSQKELWDTMVQRRERLQVIGSLAAGIAHEIKTPTQFVGDNIRFLQDSFPALLELLDKYDELYRETGKGDVGQDLLDTIRNAREKADLQFLREHIPATLEQTQEGISRVAKIARAMKEFSHRDLDQQQHNVDLNHALETTITIARNEWKYVAEVETVFEKIPLISCRLGELNQVFLNLLVNAAQAIGDLVKGTQKKGLIRVSTRAESGWVEIAISDTGTGIHDDIKPHIFEPFFTTKETGKGTGQGLALVRTLVEQHGGNLRFESTPGTGTTFYVRVPVAGLPADSATQAAAAT